MARKTLKSALKAHESRKAQVAHAKKVEEASLRKESSIHASIGGGKKRKAKPSSDSTSTGEGKHRISSGKKRTSDVRAFESDDTILLIGEGNFSFAHSLLLPPHKIDPARLLATAFDSEKQCYEKYPDAVEHVSALRRLAQRDDVVAFNVDAGELLASKAVRARSVSLHPNQSSAASWSKIVFNFPHVGAGHKDESRNVMANQLLIIRFLVSSSQLLNRGTLPSYVPGQAKKTRDGDMTEDEDIASEDGNPERGHFDNDGDLDSSQPSPVRIHAPDRAGSVLITLRDCKPYTLWDVPTLAKRLSSVWQPIASGAPSLAKGQRLPTQEQIGQVLALGEGKSFRVWRSYTFRPSDWPLYAHRRTIGWREGVSTSNNEDILRNEQRSECRTWQLGLAG